jgi:hypothetical protein
MCTQLHERLRLAREKRGISLATIARQWGVREQNLVLIEQNAFEELPTGLYGRTAVRSYASAVGLSPDDALAEVSSRLRAPEDPLDGLARVRGLQRQQAGRASEMTSTIARWTMDLSWRPQAAAVLDGAVLIALDAILLMLTAKVAGAHPADVLRVAAPWMLVIFALIAAFYFVLLGGIGRATLGSRVAHASSDMTAFDGVVRMLRLRRA